MSEIQKRLCALLFLASAAACSGGTVAPPPLAPSAAVSGTAPGSAPVFAAEVCVHPSCPAPNGLVQALGGPTISQGIANPTALALERSGDLYVANSPSTGATITAYAPGSVTPSHTVAGFPGTPHWLSVAPTGELYVAGNEKTGCCQITGAVVVYDRVGKKLRALSGIASFPGAPAFDSEGNAYVPNFADFPGYITVYRPHAAKPFRAIQSGIGFPLALAFDAHGNLYVLDGTFNGSDEILVYAPGGDSPERTISMGLSESSAMAFDEAGNLFVANRGTAKVRSSVTVYPPGASAPARTIGIGMRDPIALGFDASGTLYVANVPEHGYGNVTAYAPGAAKPERIYRFHQSVSALAVAH